MLVCTDFACEIMYMFAPKELMRAARVALNLSQNELAEHAGVSMKSVQNLEKGLPLNSATLQKIQTALEELGIEFLNSEGGRGPGLRVPESAVTLKLKLPGR